MNFKHTAQMHAALENLIWPGIMFILFRMPLGSLSVNKAPSLNAATRRKLFSSSLQLNLNCVRQDSSVENPLLRPLGDCEGSYMQMISARTPLIEPESDRESCV